MSDPLQTIAAISLFVEDLPAAKAFYTEVFGVGVMYEDDASAGVKLENVIINLVKAEQAGELVEPNPVPGPESGSRFQLSIWVDDVDAVCATLAERGAKVLTGPVDRPWGMRTATFNDPAGNSWEVAQGLGD